MVMHFFNTEKSAACAIKNPGTSAPGFRIYFLEFNI